MGTASAFDTRRIGWIGLGKMGLPICERLVAQGFEVATLTRNPEERERATRANLQSESKISGVVSNADLVFPLSVTTPHCSTSFSRLVD
jgi:3-hydroxyisobutyrate dehydrogenase